MTAFVDTSFYVAVLNETDALHVQAKSLLARCHRFVTTEYVIVETGNSVQKSRARNTFPNLARELYTTSDTVVVQSSNALLMQALDVFEKYKDKQWSLTDCTSFVVMRDMGLANALTADHHFQQASYNALLRFD